MEVERVFKKYYDNITRAEYHNFHPESSSVTNMNVPNKKIVFKIKAEDDFVIPKFQYYISGEFAPIDSTKTYTASANVKLVDNFIAHLFSRIELKKHNTLLDQIENVGVASTVKILSQYGFDYTGSLINAGFKSRYQGGGNFSAVGSLSNLGLGFFDDNEYPIYRGGYELIFYRNTDDDALLRYKTKKADGSYDADTLPVPGKVVINEFIIRVSIVEYDEITKVQLIQDLQHLSSQKKYRLLFKSWQCIEHKPVVGNTFRFDISNIYRNVRKPLFGFVVFQTNRAKNQEKDNSIFDNMNVKNIGFEVNGRRYPEENLELDWVNEKYALAYDMFCAYRRILNGGVENFSNIHPDTFKMYKTIYAIDLTNHPENISGSTNNVILHVDFNKNVASPSSGADGTICYVCIVSANDFVYDIVKNTVTENLD